MSTPLCIGLAALQTYSSAASFQLWNSRNTELIELIGPQGVHPLVRSAAAARRQDASLLGRGAFASVFLGRPAVGSGHGRVAVKVQQQDAPSLEQSRLAREAEIMRAVSGSPGFTRLLYEGQQCVFGSPSDVLVMELLGDTVQRHCWDLRQGGGGDDGDSVEDELCEGNHLSAAGVVRLGRDVLRALKTLHATGFVHNDIKPANILFGAAGSGRESEAFLVDFGTATLSGECDVDADCRLHFGGGTPLFGSLAQINGQPTRPVDDVESLCMPRVGSSIPRPLADRSAVLCLINARSPASPAAASATYTRPRPHAGAGYNLAFLSEGTLPWQWEPPERVANIKRRLFEDMCAIDEGDACSAALASADCCSTTHCLATYDDWDATPTLNELWGHVLEAHADPDGAVDHDACIAVLDAALAASGAEDVHN